MDGLVGVTSLTPPDGAARFAAALNAVHWQGRHHVPPAFLRRPGDDPLTSLIARVEALERDHDSNGET
jgi:hypothetical protein